MRIRIIKATKEYKEGQVLDISPTKGKKLIREGIAELSKDMTERDYKHG